MDLSSYKGNIKTDNIDILHLINNIIENKNSKFDWTLCNRIFTYLSVALKNNCESIKNTQDPLITHFNSILTTELKNANNNPKLMMRSTNSACSRSCVKLVQDYFSAVQTPLVEKFTEIVGNAKSELTLPIDHSVLLKYTQYFIDAIIEDNSNLPYPILLICNLIYSIITDNNNNTDIIEDVYIASSNFLYLRIISPTIIDLFTSKDNNSAAIVIHIAKILQSTVSGVDSKSNSAEMTQFITKNHPIIKQHLLNMLTKNSSNELFSKTELLLPLLQNHSLSDDINTISSPSTSNNCNFVKDSNLKKNPFSFSSFSWIHLTVIVIVSAVLYKCVFK